MTKIVITSYEDAYDEHERETRLLSFLERLSDVRGNIARLHEENGVLCVDWLHSPGMSDIAAVVRAWAIEGGFYSNHYLNGKYLGNLDEDFPADIGGPVRSMLTYSDHPESEMEFTEFVRCHAAGDSAVQAVMHGELAQKWGGLALTAAVPRVGVAALWGPGGLEQFDRSDLGNRRPH
jgi:hypothetical protein